MRRQYQQKRRIEVWRRALAAALDIKGVDGLSLEQIYQRQPALQENSVGEVKRGKFKQQKVPQILLEVLSVETVGNCYLLKCSDILGLEGQKFSTYEKHRMDNTIDCMFHSDCKELMQT